MMARLIADTPKLKAAVSENDPPTVQSPIEDIARQNQLTTNLLLVTNKTGRVLATVGISPRAAHRRRESAVDPRGARRP